MGQPGQLGLSPGQSPRFGAAVSPRLAPLHSGSGGSAQAWQHGSTGPSPVASPHAMKPPATHPAALLAPPSQAFQPAPAAAQPDAAGGTGPEDGGWAAHAHAAGSASYGADPEGGTAYGAHPQGGDDAAGAETSAATGVADPEGGGYAVDPEAGGGYAADPEAGGYAADPEGADYAAGQEAAAPEAEAALAAGGPWAGEDAAAADQPAAELPAVEYTVRIPMYHVLRVSQCGAGLLFAPSQLRRISKCRS